VLEVYSIKEGRDNYRLREYVPHSDTMM